MLMRSIENGLKMRTNHYCVCRVGQYGSNSIFAKAWAGDQSASIAPASRIPIRLKGNSPQITYSFFFFYLRFSHAGGDRHLRPVSDQAKTQQLNQLETVFPFEID
ncbi:hypothetical protein TNCV_3176041 [Trichonephila clavipes]|nr:hypothetical protein TNCV_3176041 [Trichonephila clavipes]